jgi:hypothetical protein
VEVAAGDSDYLSRELLGIEIWTIKQVSKSSGAVLHSCCCSERELELETEVVGGGAALGDSDGLGNVQVVGEVHVQVLVNDLAPAETEVPGVLKEELSFKGGLRLESVNTYP